MSVSSRKKDRKRRKAQALRDAEGRLHLVLHRDAFGAEHIALRAPVFKESWQNEIAASAAATAHSMLEGAATSERVARVATTAMAATSRLVDGLLAQAPPGALACKAGCDHCCYQVVGVTPPEALAIFAHLKQTRTSEELATLVTHVAQLRDKAQGLSSSERFSPEHPCAFLDTGTGQCTIYEVRPLACRGMNSLDADECARRLRDPEARAAFIAAGVGGRSFMEPIRGFHAISAGLQLSLSELHHLDMRPLELTLVMHLLLTGGEARERAWLAGESPFESALASDKTRDLGMREASGALVLERKPEP